MNLVFFLVTAAILVISTGEFGKYPFGSAGNAISLLDLLVGACGTVFLIWKAGIKKQIDFPGIFWILIVFLAVGVMSLIVNSNFSGLLYLVRLVFYSLLFWIGFDLVKNKSARSEVLQHVMLLTGIIMVASGVAQLILFPNFRVFSDFGFDPHILRMSGTFLDPNFLGAFLVFVYAISVGFFIRNRKKLYLFLMAIFFGSIILTFSRSVWIMFGVFNLLTIWFLPKKIIYVVAVSSLIAILFVPRVQERLLGLATFDVTAIERVESWKKGIELFKINPIFGIGYNNIRSVSFDMDLIKPFSSNGGNSGSGVDSSWLLILSTTGVIGLLIFATFYIKLVIAFGKKNNSPEPPMMFGLLIALLVESQFVNSLFYPAIMLLFFLLSGIFYAKIKS